MRHWPSLVLLLLFGFLPGALPLGAQSQSGTQANILVVDATAPSHPFPHFWEQMFGSGRAILSLRDSYRSDLRAVKQVTDFTYVRFHGIFQ